MKGKLAVLHVALNPVTGPWSVMRELAKAQANSGNYAGVGLGLITYRDWSPVYEYDLKALGLPVFRANAPKLFGTGSFVQQHFRPPPIECWAADLAKETGADGVVIHFHNAWMSGVFLPLDRIAIPVRTVVTFHGVNQWLPLKPLRFRVHCWMARRTEHYADRLTSVNRGHLPLANKLFGILPEKFSVVPNGISNSSLRGCRYIKTREVFTVGHVGAIVEGKGWRFAVEAVLKLAAEGRKIRLILAGDGPEAGDAAALGSSHPSVIDYRGFVRQVRETLMPQLDVLCVMSDQEGLPVSIIEALSLGIPVVATAVGGIPEAIVDGTNGRLVERTTGDLYSALADIMDDSKGLAQLSQGARIAFEERYGIDKIVGQYDAVYQG